MTYRDTDRITSDSQGWRKRSLGKSELRVPNDQACVYIAWGLDESRPLYVGKSRSLMQRLGSHARSSAWWPYLHRLEVYGYRSDEAALIAEAEAIHELRPAYNQVGNRGTIPPMVRYLRRRKKPEPSVYGSPISTDEIPAAQLAIIARVQNRRKDAA